MRAPDDACLDAARREGDFELDCLVSPHGAGAWRFVRLLHPMRCDDAPWPLDIPASLRRSVVPALPSWACPHRLRRAQRFADGHLPQITVALFCAALPVSYTSVPGARILVKTGRLRNDVDLRVNETARFVLDVLAPHAFDPGGRGRLAVGRVRLIHAAVRATLGRMPDMTPTRDEIPINQEDLLGALCLFSVVVLHSLERLGVRIDAGEREDFVHLWAVIGSMLGVRDDLLFTDLGEAESVTARIGARQMRGSDEGRALMRILLEGMARHVIVPGLRNLPAHLTAHLVGPERAAMLGLAPPDSSAWPLALTAGQSMMSFGPFRRITARFGRSLIEAINGAKLASRSDRQGADGSAPTPEAPQSWRAQPL